MKRSKFTNSQIMGALSRVDAVLAVPDVCRELGISSANFYKLWAKYGGADTSMMARMKELEAENVRLKKMCIKEKLKVEIVTEALAKKWWGPSHRREMDCGQSEIKRSRSVWRSNPLGSVSLDTPMKQRTILRTNLLLTG